MKTIEEWCKYIAEWREKKGFETDWGNVIEKLMLCVTELSEAAEAYRNLELWNDGVTGYYPAGGRNSKIEANFKEEIADSVIRLFDICGSLGIDLEAEIISKMKVNEKRPRLHGKNC